MSNQSWAWGYNSSGQLGAGTSNIPVPVKDLTNIVSISTSENHGLVLKTDGTVWAWGYNNNGQLGDSTSGTNRNIPVQVKDPSDPTGFLTNVTAVSAGANHSLALKNDKTVWAWGSNSHSQLGDGSSGTIKNIPVQVKDSTDPSGFLTNITDISAGRAYSLALKNDKTVWAWGFNSFGQLGDGTAGWGYDKNIPVQVKDSTDPSGFLTNITAISAGMNHSVSLKNDKTVWTWGYNYDGQLGDGTSGSGTNKKMPVQVKDPTNPFGFLTNVTAISAGGYHSLAIKNDETVWTWGSNSYGQLGDGSSESNKNIPIQVKDLNDPSGFLTNATNISAGWYHSLILKNDETVWAWGSNSRGQLGDGTFETSKNTPVQVKNSTGFLTTVIAISTGAYHSLVLKSDGAVWAYGSNSYGQLGDGTSNMPVQVKDLSNILSISAGSNHSLTLRSDGTVWAWGSNSYGQLGDGTSGSESNKNIPVQVKDPTDPSGFLTNVAAISAGWYHSLALKNDGTVWAWGFNTHGQLGDGTSGWGANKNIPVQVKDSTDSTGFLTNVTYISAGWYHSLALKNDETVWAWGHNYDGQLGNGSSGSGSNKNIPVQVKDSTDPSGFLTNVIAISAGGYHGLVLKNDETVWSWGSNSYGQLGDSTSGTWANKNIPVQVEDSTGFLTNVTAISAGGLHSLALKNDKTVWAWGKNHNGQLGNGTSGNGADKNTPVQIKDSTGFLTNVTAISAGWNHSLAIKDNKTVWAWGYNYYGQLGDGSSGNATNKHTPVQVKNLTNVMAISAGESHSLSIVNIPSR